MVGMEELEDTLLGVAKDGSVLVMPGGENVGVKAKRRKDYIRTGSTERVWNKQAYEMKHIILCVCV